MGLQAVFILHLSRAGQPLHYAEFAHVNDMAYEEATNTLYFVEQYAYDSARLMVYDLSNGQQSLIAHIDDARLNARIVKT